MTLPPHASRFCRLIVDAEWLTAARATRLAWSFLAVSLLGALAWVATARHSIDLAGRPLGTDFASFWTASQMALAGRAVQVYDPAAHHAAQMAVFGPRVDEYAFFYPPLFLTICLPLALAPYAVSLGAWLTATGYAYAKVTRRFLGEGRVWWVPILGFTGVFMNAGHGQNGFLSAALFGCGVLLLDRRPILAGVVLGCLAYKPQLGLVIPIALLAGGRWRTIFGAAATVVVLGLASVGLFTAQAWQGFLAVSPLARTALEQNLVGFAKMPTAFAAVRLWHGPVALAYAVQALVALGVCGALIALQRKAYRAPAEGPAMVAAALLASPFMLDYDLVILAIPLAWLTREGLRTGFRSWEKFVLGAGFVVPLVSRPIMSMTGVPIGPLVVGAVFWLVLRRWEKPADGQDALAPVAGPG